MILMCVREKEAGLPEDSDSNDIRLPEDCQCGGNRAERL